MSNAVKFEVGTVVQILPGITKAVLPDKMNAYTGVVSRVTAIIVDDLTDSKEAKQFYYLLDNNDFVWPESALCAVYDPTNVAPRYSIGSLVDIIPYDEPEWCRYLRLSWINDIGHDSSTEYISIRDKVADLHNVYNPDILKQLKITNIKTFDNGGIGYILEDFSQFYIDERVLVSSNDSSKSQYFRTKVAAALYSYKLPKERALFASQLKNILGTF